MTIRVLVSGTLHGDPEIKTSQGGKRYTKVKLRADGQNGATTWVSLAAFGDLADTLAGIKAGDSIAVSGKVKLTAWANKTTGEPTAGLDLMVDSLISLVAKPKPKTIGRSQRAYSRQQPLPVVSGTAPADFDDNLAEWRT